MQQYELTLVFTPELSEEQVDTIIKELGLKVAHKASWGKRLLSYEIKGYKEGLFVYTEIEADSQAHKKLVSALNVHDDILRYLLIKPDDTKSN